jgi:hypothetical protein
MRQLIMDNQEAHMTLGRRNDILEKKKQEEKDC